MAQRKAKTKSKSKKKPADKSYDLATALDDVRKALDASGWILEVQIAPGAVWTDVDARTYGGLADDIATQLKARGVRVRARRSDD